MKQVFITASLCAAFTFTQAQTNTSGIFAVTAEKAGSFDYSSLRKLNAKDGSTLQSFFGKSTSFEAKTVRSARTYNNSSMFRGADSLMNPMGDVTGAVAYDAKHNRLFFAALGINQLRYLDLNTGNPSFVYIDDQKFGEARTSAGAQISRMVITADGTGYALSNNGDHLIRFSTGKQIQITDLGAVKDNPSDTVNGYHKNCTCMSYGGDMIADSKGDLYVITANNRVHKIDVSTLTITYQGTIKGLPEGFTTNGAAVDEDGRSVIISNAASTPERRFAYHVVDMKSLTARALSGDFLNASDLASSNVIQLNESKQRLGTAQFTFSETTVHSNAVRIYPNPVTGNKINVMLSNLASANYAIALFDLQGRITETKSFNVRVKAHKEELNAPAAKGLYILNLIDEKGKTISNFRFMVGNGN